MNNVIQMKFPKQFVFGKDAILNCSKYLKPLGNKFLFIVACGSAGEKIREKIENSFINEEGCVLEFLDKDAEGVYERVINEIATYADSMHADVIVGVGGGKALDLARAASLKCNAKPALIPTVASTNAAGTRISVVNDEKTQAFAGLLTLEHYPELIIADTEIIVQAPERTLASGIADSLGTVIEGIISAKRLDKKTDSSAFAWHSFEKSGEILFNQGYKAYMAAKAHCVNKDFNDVVEQIIFWNGIYHGAAGWVINIPHILEHLLPVDHSKLMHGEIIGYSVLPLLVIEGVSLEFIHKYIDFCLSIHIPVNFEQLGIEKFDIEKVRAIAHGMVEAQFVDTISIKIDGDTLYQNILVAEEIVNDYLKSKSI